MSVEEAKKLLDEITNKDVFSQEEEFQINELSKFICEQEKSGNYAAFVGCKYVENNKDDLGLYYLELSIQYGYLPSYKYAADVYYWGSASCGKDLKKAFEYYCEATKVNRIGDGTWESPDTDVHNEAKMVLATMYKNGEYVEKNFAEYKRLIDEVYREVIDGDDNQIKSDVLKEKAIIALEENNEKDAYNYLVDAIYYAEEFYYQTYMFEQLYTIEVLVDMLYEHYPIDLMDISFTDIFYLLKRPCIIKFNLDNEDHYIESLRENGLIVIKFEDQWFKEAGELVDKGMVGESEFKDIVENIDYWEVKEWKN